MLFIKYFAFETKFKRIVYFKEKLFRFFCIITVFFFIMRIYGSVPLCLHPLNPDGIYLAFVFSVVNFLLGTKEDNKINGNLFQQKKFHNIYNPGKVAHYALLEDQL